MWAVVGAVVLGAAEIHDKAKFGKKALHYVVLFITLWSVKWAFEYTISQSGKPGIDTAAVIAAVLTPLAGLQAMVFKYYLNESTESERIQAGTPSTVTTDLSVTATKG